MERLVRRDAVGVVQASVLTLIIAGLAGYLTYTIHLGAAEPLDWKVFWQWMARSNNSWDPMGTLALIAGVVLPLYLATQVGDATRARNSTSLSAHTVGVETLTGAACLCAAVLSWMTVPAVIAGKEVAPVNILLAFAAPILFASLFSISAPSEDGERLAQVQSQALLAEMRRLSLEFDIARTTTESQGEVTRRGACGLASCVTAPSTASWQAQWSERSSP
ncbi:MAG TPA: hypothetical protein VGC37_08585 [Friedmanniella sp.]